MEAEASGDATVENGTPGAAASRRRIGLIAVDQAIAGASNLLLALLAAQTLGAASFGYFSLILLLYAIGQGSARALVSEPLLLHPDVAAESPGRPLGSALLVGTAIGAVVVGIGAAASLWAPPLGHSTMILGCSMPLLVAQDLGRYLGLATRSPARALWLDVPWLVLILLGSGVLLISSTKVLELYVGIWCVSGALLGLVVVAQHGRGSELRSLGWLRFTWPIAWRYLVSWVSRQSGGLTSSAALAALAGPAALAGVQGAALLERPFVMYQLSALADGTAEVARIGRDGRRLRKIARHTTVLTFIAAAINGLIILFLPDSLGELVLGDTWAEATPLLLPTAVLMATMGAASGSKAALLGLREVRTTLRIDVVTAICFVVATIAGAAVGGAELAIWCAAAVYLASGIATWLAFVAATGKNE